MKGRAIAFVLVSGLVMAALWPGLGGPFLHDDHPNLAVLAVGPPSLDTAWVVATGNASGPLRRPIANLSLASNYWAHGLQDPFGFKLINLLLHLLCALVVWRVAAALLRIFAPAEDRPASAGIGLFAAVLWVCSPIQVSTALYVVQRMTQLETLFALLALWLVLRWLEKADFSARASAGCALGFAALTALALGSKENAAVIPAIAAMLTVVWWAQQRTLTDSPATPNRMFFWGLMAGPTLALLAVAAIMPEQMLGAYTGRDFTVAERMATQPVVLWFYVQLFLLPALPMMGLFHDDFPVYQFTDWESIVAVSAWAAALLAALLVRRRWPILAVGLLWFLIGHAVESSVIGLEMVYEHRNYFPLVGLAVVAAWLGYRLSEAFPPVGRIGLIALPALLLTLSFLRSVDWSSEGRFYSSEYVRHPNSLRAMVGETYRLQSVPGTGPQRSALIHRIKESHPELIWPHLTAIAAQCEDPGVDVPWRLIHELLRGPLPDPRVRETLKFILDKIVTDQCPHVDRARFSKTLELVYLRAVARDNPEDAETTARFLGWAHWKWADPALAERWMRASSEAHPQAFEALFDLFYFQLNSGKVEAAREVLDELMQRRPHLDTWIDHRLDDAAESLEAATREQSAGETPQ